MKLTRKKAISISIELWTWLAETGSEYKHEWPGWKKYGAMVLACPFCEYSRQRNKLALYDAGLNTYCPSCPYVRPNILANTQLDSPAASLALISFTCNCVILARGFCSPGELPFRARPFALQSLRLSARVPKNRWAGFTQGGLSQWCKTHMSLGIELPLKV